MDANELRALQAPLKKQYREQPETARTPARAAATLELGEVGCRLRSWGGETQAGLHPATGGDGSLACSADMLLEALVACAGENNRTPTGGGRDHFAFSTARMIERERCSANRTWTDIERQRSGVKQEFHNTGERRLSTR